MAIIEIRDMEESKLIGKYQSEAIPREGDFMYYDGCHGRVETVTHVIGHTMVTPFPDVMIHKPELKYIEIELEVFERQEESVEDGE